jgi:hypothetical protein
VQLDVWDLLARGNSLVQNRLEAARKLIYNPFKLHLGRGLYGECLVSECLVSPSPRRLVIITLSFQ